ncbi:hypothetical protein [Parvicella tangerina]|nr:hypothetical protein [Parvicella tangerina]
MEKSNAKNLIGNKYAHLLIDTKEECEARPAEQSCAYRLEILNDSQVDIAFTDIVHRANFYINNNKLIIESTSGIPEDLVFEILQNGDLKLQQEIWIKYENSFYE